MVLLSLDQAQDLGQRPSCGRQVDFPVYKGYQGADKTGNIEVLSGHDPLGKKSYGIKK